MSLYPSPLVQRLDFSHLQLLKTTFIRRDFRHVESDVVLAAPLLDARATTVTKQAADLGADRAPVGAGPVGGYGGGSAASPAAASTFATRERVQSEAVLLHEHTQDRGQLRNRAIVFAAEQDADRAHHRNSPCCSALPPLRFIDQDTRGRVFHGEHDRLGFADSEVFAKQLGPVELEICARAGYAAPMISPDYARQL